MPKMSVLSVWFHSFIILLLLGVMLPTGSVFAGTPRPGSFDKLQPANGAVSQPVSLVLRWDLSSQAAAYEYCVDTTDNNVCDAGWTGTGTTNFASVSMAANTIYFWHVRAMNGSETVYSNSAAWWSFTTGPESPYSRKTLAFPLASPGAMRADGVLGGSIDSSANLLLTRV